MKTERYPADLILSIDDFNECGWKEVLANLTDKTYLHVHSAFSTAAHQAMDAGQQKHGKALFLLAEACSMMLRPESTNTPFKPLMVMGTARSPLPEDFSKEDIDFFVSIVATIDDCLLKARLADLIWLLQRRRGVNFALMAIDAYMAIPLAEDTWFYTEHCWARAISLIRQIRNGLDERLQNICSTIFHAYEAAIQNDNFWALILAKFILEHELTESPEQATNIARQLKDIAATYKDTEVHTACHFYQISAAFFLLVDDTERWVNVMVEIAEAYACAADKAIESDSAGGFLALNFYDQAIKTYRTVPRLERPRHQIDEKLQELQSKLKGTGKISLEQMAQIKSPAIDITDLMENSRKAVRGKNFIEALKVFCNLCPPPKQEKLRTEIIAQLKRPPLTTMFGGVIIGRDGRVIAKRPAFDFSDERSKNNEILIRETMIRNYGIYIDLYARAVIMPALEELLLEHRVREADFVQIVQDSPIVPKDRVMLVAKALFYGYDKNFAIALHLLVPQIENIVRASLKSNNMLTTAVDPFGIENEKGLSALMDTAEIEKIWGEDLSFELRALFCDPFGSNLRNEVAHGLIDDLYCYSAASVYAWWFALKLAFNTYYNATHNIS